MISQIVCCSRFILRKQKQILLLLFVSILFTAWFWKGSLSGHGGLPIFGRLEIPVAPFFQNDPLWSQEKLGTSSETIGSAGCAISSAAMVLKSYGVDIDPKKLNDYLLSHDGYEGAAWIKWEIAASFPPSLAEHRYEDFLE